MLPLPSALAKGVRSRVSLGGGRCARRSLCPHRGVQHPPPGKLRVKKNSGQSDCLPVVLNGVFSRLEKRPCDSRTSQSPRFGLHRAKSSLIFSGVVLVLRARFRSGARTRHGAARGDDGRAVHLRRRWRFPRRLGLDPRAAPEGGRAPPRVARGAVGREVQDLRGVRQEARGGARGRARSRPRRGTGRERAEARRRRPRTRATARDPGEELENARRRRRSGRWPSFAKQKRAERVRPIPGRARRARPAHARGRRVQAGRGGGRGRGRAAGPARAAHAQTRAPAAMGGGGRGIARRARARRTLGRRRRRLPRTPRCSCSKRWRRRRGTWASSGRVSGRRWGNPTPWRGPRP